ncbi:MAG TPA: 30S ribosome-binding factor RbfA [Bauldia sp.]
MQRNASIKPGVKSGRAPSQRQLRVGEVIRHALAEILQRGDVHDPVFEGSVITVPEVRMAPDLKCATVFVMPLGGKGNEAVLEAFDRNKKYLRGEVARRVNLRAAPDLRFRIDTSFEQGARVDAMLRSPEVTRDLGAADAAAPDGSPPKDEPHS